jgi:D-alanine-D-alanine ligase
MNTNFGVFSVDRKPVVCLLCGGQSPEHEISLLSAWSVYQALDREQYDVHVVGINKQGVWQHYGHQEDFLADCDDPRKIRLAEGGRVCFLCRNRVNVRLWELGTGQEYPLDVAFPVLHGANGEDGTIQGLFQMLGLPYVGCDQMSSANCMDKTVTKLLLNCNGLTTARGITLRKKADQESLRLALDSFALPLFVKPACTGSSVGVSKVKTPAQLSEAVTLAFQYDDKVLIEEAIPGREIECAVLEDGEELICPPPGEVIPHDEFYSYAAKYLSKNGATLEVPAHLSPGQIKSVQELAKRAFTALDCRGMARVDFFLKPDDTWVINEINTIPGFTSISLYPRLMLNAGITYPELVSKLLAKALDTKVSESI